MEEKEKKYPDQLVYDIWAAAHRPNVGTEGQIVGIQIVLDREAKPAPAEPVAWAISYDGKTPYALWDYGDGALLDLEIKRLGGTASKMPLYAAPVASAPDLQREIDARKAAQIENGALKARIARARLDLMDELKKQGWAPAAPAGKPVACIQHFNGDKGRLFFLDDVDPPPCSDSYIDAVKWTMLYAAPAAPAQDECGNTPYDEGPFTIAAPAPATELSDADLQAIHEAWIQTTDGYIALMRQAIAASKGGA